MRVLLTEGSGLTSREVATRLGELGHEVEVLSSTTLCLARFTRHVRAVHRIAPFATDPIEWLESAQRVATARHVDLLFPTQEPVAVLSAFADRLRVTTIAPPFESLRRVFDKVSAAETMRTAAVPQPATVVARSEADLSGVEVFPVFVKRPISTASTGVRRAHDRSDLVAAARELGFGDDGLVIQHAVTGELAMVQAVADRGRVIAHHANLRAREGVSGGASTKVSLAPDRTFELVQRLVTHLHWHGGLSLDVILTSDGPYVIDINPRLVEPTNAFLAGVDLVDAMLSLASRGPSRPQPESVPGVRSHLLLLAILDAARGDRARRRVARELAHAVLRRGEYSSGVEELTPVHHDALAAAPLAVATACTLAWPPSWRWFSTSAVGAYALSREGWAKILAEVRRVSARD